MRLKTKYKPEIICSRDATRAVINNANLGIVKGSTCLVSTDGRRLLVIPVYADDKEFGPVPKEALSLARQKRLSKKQDTISIVLNGKVELENGWTLPRPNQQEMKFPNIEHVIPDKSPMDVRVSFDASLLYGIAQSMGVSQVILTFQPGGAITVRSPGEDAYAVLMPMRYE